MCYVDEEECCRNAVFVCHSGSVGTKLRLLDQNRATTGSNLGQTWVEWVAQVMLKGPWVMWAIWVMWAPGLVNLCKNGKGATGFSHMCLMAY